MKAPSSIVATRPQRDNLQEISLEEILKRKARRRRRVAKRLAKKIPLFAVEAMQDEFPGYTLDQWIVDVTRKTRKGKSFRRPKTKAFDWPRIQKEIPEFFKACVKRTKTQAMLHGKGKDGISFTCVVRAYWYGGYGECRLRTSELIRLWQGPLKTFLSHPAMLLFEHQNELIP